MPIRGIIFLAVILVFIAYYFRNEIYNWITNSSKDKTNDDDDNTLD